MLPPVDAEQLATLHPVAYHMAEDGSWPSILARGLLSARAIVDIYQPDDETRTEILASIRHREITLIREGFPDITIRDQLPAKFLHSCMNEGVSPRITLMP
jgi:hypothetical protein